MTEEGESMTGSPAQSDASPALHWSWNLLLATSALLVVTALVLDPSTQEADLERSQFKILRGLLGFFAVAVIGVWTLRHQLNADFATAMNRWTRAPDVIAPGSLIPTFASAAAARVFSLGAIAWGLTVAIGLMLGAEFLHDLTYENGLLETLTVFSYLVAGSFALASFRNCSWAGRAPGLRRWVVLLAALGCFLIAAEETDWGQVYFNYQTPESFEHANIQSDLSLHNLAPPGVVPGTRWANWLLRGLGLFLGGVVPVLIFASSWFRKWMWSWEIPVPPPVCLGMLFLSTFIPESAETYARDNVGSELREVTIAVAVALWMLTTWQRDVAEKS